MRRIYANRLYFFIALILSLQAYFFSAGLRAESPDLKEADLFGRQLEQAVLERDTHFLDHKMDVHSFVDGVLSAEMPGQTRKQLQASLMRDFHPGRLLMPQLTKNDYTFLRAVKRGNQTRVLFRMLGEEGAINYHEYVLIKKNGQIQYSDIFIYLSGEVFSSTLGRLLMARNHRAEQLQIMHAFKSQQYKQAVQLFKSASPKTRAEKTFQLIVLQSAMQLEDEKDYVGLLENYRLQFPDDPSLALIEIDYYYLKGNMSALENTILKLNSHLGGDPYLVVLLSAALAEKGRALDGLKYLKQAMQTNPESPLVYLGTINIHVQESDYIQAVDVLKSFQIQFGRKATIELCDDLESEADNKALIESKAYKDFRPQPVKTQTI